MFVSDLLQANASGANDIASLKRAPAVRVGLVMMDSSTGAATSAVTECRQGAELSVDEAARAANLLRTSFAALPVAGDQRTARRLIESEALSAIVVAASSADIAELGIQSSEAGIVLVNCLATDDALRSAQCSPMTFHVAASAVMQSDARRMIGAEPSEGIAVELWDAGLERFGAAQLNDRFRSRFSKPMDSAAWAGWFAVKVVWEASQRARSADGRAIAEYLTRDTTVFDGHKGVPLSFRAWDHQLRQPLYLGTPATSASAASRVMRAVPTDASPSRASLDSLGASAEATGCKWR